MDFCNFIPEKWDRERSRMGMKPGGKTKDPKSIWILLCEKEREYRSGMVHLLTGSRMQIGIVKHKERISRYPRFCGSI